jgi:hypothetical protein
MQENPTSRNPVKQFIASQAPLERYSFLHLKALSRTENSAFVGAVADDHQ